MAGGVLNALNYRLDAASIAFILGHGRGEAADRRPRVRAGGEGRAGAARQQNSRRRNRRRAAARCNSARSSTRIFSPRAIPVSPGRRPPTNGRRSRSTTPRARPATPKGVVYHHRGAFLNAMGNAILFGLGPHSVYLWTLPMFHCNGWTYTWGVTAVAGTHVCLRRVDPALIFDAIAEHRVTHLSGAPIVLNMLVHAPDAVKRRFDHVVEASTGGAAPPSPVIEAMERMGFRVTHLYGLTESYGPTTVCAWQEEWDELPLAERAGKMARQGVQTMTLDRQRVVDPGDDAGRAGRRRDHRRSGGAQQHADEGLSAEPRAHRRGLRRRLVPHRRSRRSCTRTAMSRSRTARRTSSSPAARTSPRSRSRRCCTAIRR